MDIPVYLFTGFLESGKTTMLRDSLAEEMFQQGERTLVLLCEMGEEELDLPLLESQSIFVREVESLEDMTTVQLNAWCKQYKAVQVLIEFNGMWDINTFLMQFPNDWIIAQQVALMDARTIMMYNQNMRERVCDHLKECEMAVFNRVPVGADVMPFHKLVRQMSRNATIIYDYQDGNVQFDDIEDPLPYDLNADSFAVKDEDYALFFRDLMEEPEKYEGKIVEFCAQTARFRGNETKTFAAGRSVMTCCEDDMSFLALPCASALPVQARTWQQITAKITIAQHILYDEVGPVLVVQKTKQRQEPDEIVCQF